MNEEAIYQYAVRTGLSMAQAEKKLKKEAEQRDAMIRKMLAKSAKRAAK